jgi:predicted nucleic acid-binding Zn ribbon protein
MSIIKPRRVLHCIVCGVLIGDSRSKSAKTCGNTECDKEVHKWALARWLARHPRRGNYPPIYTNCCICGTTFRKTGNQKTCSVECRVYYYKCLNYNGKQRTRKQGYCVYCGTILQNTKYSKPRRLCSEACRTKRNHLMCSARARRDTALANLIREFGISFTLESTAAQALKEIIPHAEYRTLSWQDRR